MQLRSHAIEILLSIICLPLHYPDMPLQMPGTHIHTHTHTHTHIHTRKHTHTHTHTHTQTHTHTLTQTDRCQDLHYYTL